MADPLKKELIVLKERMNRLFESTLLRPHLAQAPEHWSPSVEIFETREQLVLQAELPGLSEEAIDITISDHTLAITGERLMGNAMQQGNYYRIERSYGPFAIEFPLQTQISPNRVQATYKLGVLQVTLPKVGRGRTKPLKVKLN